MRGKWIATALLMALSAAGLAASGGCTAFGFFASAIPKSADAEYKGLAKQKVAIMVWADRGVRIDFPNLQLDLGNGVQAYLISKTDEDSLKETQFPWEVRSVLRFQKEHPELEGRSITEWAHRITGVSRLVFVEVPEFSTRAGTAVQLLKGGMVVNVKVLEISNGKSKIAYERQNIGIAFPEKSKEGVVDVPESAIYGGTLNLGAKTIAELFYPHIIED